MMIDYEKWGQYWWWNGIMMQNLERYKMMNANTNEFDNDDWKWWWYFVMMIENDDDKNWCI